MYVKNNKKMIKETDDESKKWKDMPYSWVGRILVKMAILPQAVYRLNVLPFKLPMTYFTDLEQSSNL